MSKPHRDSPEPELQGPADGSPVPGMRRFLPLLILVAGLLAFLAFGGHHYISLEALKAHRGALMALVAELGVVAMLAFVAVYAVMVAFSVPGGLIMTVTGGFLFGTFAGAAASVIGATLGAIALFLAARTALGDLLRDRAGTAVARMRAGFREDAFSYLLVLRLIPLFPFWLVNLVPALVGVSLRIFVVGTFLGIIPASLVYASLGNGLGALFAAGRPAKLGEAIYAPEVLLPIAGLVVLSLLPVVYKKVRKRKG